MGKTKGNSTIEKQKWKGHDRRDRVLISKMGFNIRFPSEIKVLLFDPFFSNWVSFKKLSIKNCSTNSKSSKAICFFSSKFKS